MKIKNLFKNTSFLKSFTYIFGSQCIVYIIQFVTSVLITRVVDKAAYGSLNVATNALGYFNMFCGLGLSSGLLQYAAEKRADTEKNSISKQTINISTYINVIIAVLLIVIPLFLSICKTPESNKYLQYMFGMPLLTYLNTMLTIQLRIKKRNRQIGIASVIYAVTHTICVLGLSYFFGVVGYIIGGYISMLIYILTNLIFIGKEDLKTISVAPKLEKRLWNQIFKYSVVCCITNMMTTIMHLLDVTCIAQVADATTVASYKVATLIPAALMYLPTSVVFVMYPNWAEHNTDADYIKKSARQTIIYLCLVNAVISLFLYILAPFVVNILWGEQYLDSVQSLRILSINYFISGSFIKVLGNLIVILKKVKINLISTTLSSLLNIGLNILLIKKIGAEGAAVATCLVSVFLVLFTGTAFLLQLKKLKTKGN